MNVINRDVKHTFIDLPFASLVRTKMRELHSLDIKRALITLLDSSRNVIDSRVPTAVIFEGLDISIFLSVPSHL